MLKFVFGTSGQQVEDLIALRIADYLGEGLNQISELQFVDVLTVKILQFLVSLAEQIMIFIDILSFFNQPRGMDLLVENLVFWLIKAMLNSLLERLQVRVDNARFLSLLLGLFLRHVLSWGTSGALRVGILLTETLGAAAKADGGLGSSPLAACDFNGWADE